MLGKLTKAGTANYEIEKISTMISESAVFEGNLTLKESARIEGTIKGSINSQGLLIIGEKGRVIGDIKAGSVSIAGHVEGNLEISEKTEIMGTGALKGDIVTNKLIIDENAKFEGNCAMKSGTGHMPAASDKSVKSNSKTAKHAD